MPQSKHGRLNEDMKRMVVAIIGEMKDPRVQGFLTVTRVEVTQDLSSAKVHVSVLDGPRSAEATAEAVAALKRAAGHIRGEVSRRMHIRKAPEFIFLADGGAAYAAHINEMIEELKDNE
ncbi:MAG: 30S ribosome-binding factor RbfA [Oscillospiraceae bacterium]|nr:30S ribosome-binding factor RbfA [Oscillospiraceae bacterium]